MDNEGYRNLEEMYAKCNPDVVMRECFDNLNELTSEEECIYNSLSKLIFGKVDNVRTRKDILDILEALAYEFKLRNVEKTKTLKTLKSRIATNQAKVKEMETK